MATLAWCISRMGAASGSRTSRRCVTASNGIAGRALIEHHFGIALGATAAGGTDELADFEKARPLCKLRLWHRPALPNPDVFYWDIAEDLVAALTLDLPEMLTTCNREHVAKWPIAKADLWRLALAQVRAEGLLPAHALDVGGGASVHILEGDRTFFAASHVLFLEDYVGPASMGCVVAMPRRHTMVFHRIADLRVVQVIQSMLNVIPRMCHEGPGSISPSLYWWQPSRALMLLPSQLVGTTLQFHPPAPFIQMLNGLPQRA